MHRVCVFGTDSFAPLSFSGHIAAAQSGDAGRVVVIRSNQSSCRLEDSFQSGFFVLLDHSQSSLFVECNDVSSNGFVAGSFAKSSPFLTIEAAILTTVGTTPLGFLALPADPDDAEFRANGISDDGSLVVGMSTTDEVAGGREVVEAFIWASQTGMVGLGHINHLPGQQKSSVAYGVSSDGNYVVGKSTLLVGFEPTDSQAFIWTVNTGMNSLFGVAGESRNVARKVSDDGSVVVGQSGLRAVKWEY